MVADCFDVGTEVEGVLALVRAIQARVDQAAAGVCEGVPGARDEYVALEAARGAAIEAVMRWLRARESWPYNEAVEARDQLPEVLGIPEEELPLVSGDAWSEIWKAIQTGKELKDPSSSSHPSGRFVPWGQTRWSRSSRKRM